MEFINNETAYTLPEIQVIEDELVHSLLIVNSPWWIFIILSSYLYFTLKLGPELMSKRKPFDLKNFILLYNAFQIICNAWFLIWFCSKANIIPYAMEYSCNSNDHRPLDYRLFFIKGTWLWFLLKVSDLLDTIFFVLRKKESNVSFLHIYHHTSMVASVWAYLRYVRGEQAMLIGIINSSVHVCMYTYYFLAALGPGIQKYLWWKSYITKLQLAQFCILFLSFGYLIVACDVTPMQKAYNYYVVSQVMAFILMFRNFYLNSYTKKNTAKNIEPSGSKEKAN